MRRFLVACLLSVKLAYVGLLILAGNSFAATYYFSNSGSDSNDCLSTGTACATLSKAESVSGANDTLNFQCGSTFRRAGANTYQTQGSGQTLQRYGTCTGSNDPIFTSAEVISGFSNHAANLWRRSTATSAGRNVAFDGVMAAWDESNNAGCPSSMTTDTEICYNGGFLYVRSATDPDTRWSTIERWAYQSGGVGLGLVVRHSNVTFTNIRVLRVSRALDIRTVPTIANITFDSGELGFCGFHDNLGYNPFSFGWDCATIHGVDSSGNFTITNSTIHDCGRDCFHLDQALPDGTITFQGNTIYNFFNHGAINLNKDMGAGDIAEGLVLVDDNDIYDGCSGITFGDSNDGGFANLRITNNRIRDIVSSTDSRVNQGGHACVPDGRAIAFYGSVEDIFAYIANNRIWNISEWGIDFKPKSTACLGLTMYNNTIYQAAQTGMQIRGSSYCSTPIIKNNAFVDNGSNSTGRVCCQISCDATSGCPTLDIDYNYFFPEDQTSSFIASWNDTRYTLATVKSSLSWGSSNIGDNFGASPTIFVDAATDDFTPAVGSVLIDTGVNVGIAFNGVAPDIGGIESSEATNPPAPTIGGAIIEAITPSTLTITFATNDPPMLPSSGCTGITLNGTSAAPSSCVRSGNLDMVITLDQAVLVTDTITLDYSQASGNITDNSAVEVAETAGFAVVNNVGVDLLNSSICTSADTFATGRELANSFDGDVSTEGGSSGCDCDSEFVVTCDLGANTSVGLTRVYGDALGTWYCTEYDVAYSTNGTDYTTAVTNTNCFGNQWWEQDLGGITARYLRWTITGNTVDGRTQWRELEAYGSTAPPTVMQSGNVGTTVTGATVR